MFSPRSRDWASSKREEAAVTVRVTVSVTRRPTQDPKYKRGQSALSEGVTRGKDEMTAGITVSERRSEGDQGGDLVG